MNEEFHSTVKPFWFLIFIPLSTQSSLTQSLLVNIFFEAYLLPVYIPPPFACIELIIPNVLDNLHPSYYIKLSCSSAVVGRYIPLNYFVYQYVQILSSIIK
jgi:hypothetical protein